MLRSVSLRDYMLPHPVRVKSSDSILEAVHVIGPGKMLNADRRMIFEDNGWTAWVGEVEVHEVPGDHDSMVLEPNVRVLAAQLKARLDDPEQRAKVKEGIVFALINERGGNDPSRVVLADCDWDSSLNGPHLTAV